MENYIRISGSSSKEQMCVIVSRVEFDLPNLMLQVESVPGAALAERLAALWGTDPRCAVPGEADLNADHGKIQFQVNNPERWFCLSYLR